MYNDEFDELPDELDAWAEASVAMAPEFMELESWDELFSESGDNNVQG